ncbi:MAG: hypothetical protein AUJ07_03005 [Crenarchaeota archaeon 13_1_40CM_3_53_5]|nr:MAG: hypothetical protein AUJ07_03005 [Crenarchaeota archaeon 13_1_40CM_3_53_5]
MLGWAGQPWTLELAPIPYHRDSGRVPKYEIAGVPIRTRKITVKPVNKGVNKTAKTFAKRK